MRRLVVLLGPLLVIASAERALAQRTTGILAEYALAMWTDREGLTAPRVTALAQTSDGYLWLGTNRTLIRFDGTRFAEWQDFGEGTLPDEQVAALCSSADGSLWVAFNDGNVGRIKDGRAIIYDELKRMTGGSVGAIVVDRAGVIWIAARSGLLSLRDGHWTRITSAQGLPDGPVLTAYQDRLGDLWVGSNSGVFRQAAGSKTFEQMMTASYFAHRVTRDTLGTVWITDPQTGLRPLEPQVSPAWADPPEGLGLQLLPDRQGNVWVATLGQGLWRVHHAPGDRRIEVLGRQQGLLNVVVRCLLEDQQGSLWIGTDYGLYRLAPIKLIPLKDLGVVRVVESTDDGSMWVGTTTGLVRLKGESHDVFGRHGELPGSFISALHRGTDGSLWIATDAGIARYVNREFQWTTFHGVARLNRVYSMATDGQGNLWLCDFNEGLFRVVAGKLLPVDLEGMLDHRSVLTVHRDTEGRMWVGLSEGGVGFIEVAEQLRFVKPVSPVSNSRLNSVYQRRSGEVWLGTNVGILRYADGRITAVSARNGLPSSQVFSLLGDDDTLWVGSAAGIVRLSAAAVMSAAAAPEGRNDRVAYRLWDTADGAAGAPLWLGTPSVARDAQGRMWFVTGDGISMADPTRLASTTAIPPLRIQSVFAGTARFNPVDPLTFAPHSSPVEIDYAPVTMTAEHAVRFRYRLDDFDREWTDAGTRREALFTNLPPGNYTFRVIAMATDGSSESSTALRFAIQPAYLQTRWFYGLVCLVLAAGGWQVWRLRLSYVKRHFAAIINERAKMSREIHDTLLQGLIAVALQLDVLASADDATDSGRSSLIRVRKRVEEDIRETRQSILNLRSPKLVENDLAATLREAGRRLTTCSPVQFNLTVVGTPRRLRPEVEQQILRIGEQAIVNSIRHGAATQVTATLVYEKRSTHLRVSDDGRGFDQTARHSDEGLHYGLVGMKERAQDVGGRLTITTKAGAGTTIEATVPT